MHIETSLLRRSVAQYSDGVSKPNGQIRPDAISISETLMKDTKGGAGGATSKTGKTVLMVFFGKQKRMHVACRAKSLLVFC